MSRVTVVPALRAASQMRRALSTASAGSIVCPTALSFTDTSARPPDVRPASPSRCSSTRYALTVASACPVSRVSSPRWSRLTVSPATSSSPVARTASSVFSPATKRFTTLRLTGALATTALTVASREAASMGRRSMRRRLVLTRYGVVVVGCGRVGAVLALRLAQLGVHALVIERADDVFPLPRAVAADDEVQELLDLVAPGVVDGMLADQSVRFVDRHRRGIGTIDFPRATSGYSGLAFFSQPDLERRLRAGVPELRLGVAVDGWVQDGSGVTLRLSDGSDVRASWLVGCDGASSFVRRTAGIAWRGRALSGWLVVDVAGTVPERRCFTYTCDPALPQVDMPVPGGHRWEWLVRGSDPDVRALIARDTDARADVVRAVRYRFGARRADRWAAGRVVLAGDAAHTMPPFAGQGLGAGVRDAWALAERIATGTVDRYQAQRAPHVAKMTRLSLFLGAVLETGSPQLATARDALLRNAFRAPKLGPWLSRGGPRDSRSGVLSPAAPPSR